MSLTEGVRAQLVAALQRLDSKKAQRRALLGAASMVGLRLDEALCDRCDHPRFTHLDFHGKPRSCCSCDACPDFVEEPLEPARRPYRPPVVQTREAKK